MGFGRRHLGDRGTDRSSTAGATGYALRAGPQPILVGMATMSDVREDMWAFSEAVPATVGSRLRWLG